MIGMKVTRRLILILLLVAASISFNSSCVNKMPESYNQQTKQLYILTDVVNSIGILQLAAENAVSNNILTLSTARTIVQFCVDANTTIGQYPNGWYTIVNTAYIQLKAHLTLEELNKFSGSLFAFEIILNSFSAELGVE